MRKTVALCSLAAGLALGAGCKEPDFSKKSAPVAASPAPSAPTAPSAPVAAPPPPSAPVAMPMPRPPPPPAQAPKGPVGTNIGEKIAKFDAELVLVRGDATKKSKLDSLAKGPITAYTIVGTTCPATRAYIDRAKALESAYMPKGVRFVYLYPNVDETDAVKLSFHKKNGYQGALVDDQGSKIAKALACVRTSEIVVADKEQKIAYRGPIDDSRTPAGVKQKYVADALDALLAGKTPTTQYATVFA